jgi:hypothetical protein
MNNLSSEAQSVYLVIAQYPMLAQPIRDHMRAELYRCGIITPPRLERQVHEKAVLSQQREGLLNVLEEEDASQWEQRLQQIRDQLTDLYFAHNLPINQLKCIIEDLLTQNTAPKSESPLPFNPELASLDLLLKQAEQYEALPPERRALVAHHLEAIRVVLIKTLISDQLRFVEIAKNWFTAADFRSIRAQRVGDGKIGGKAGGMLLAWKILQGAAPQVAERVTLPRSCYLGANVFSNFLELNGLGYIDQKYKPLEQIRDAYPQIQQAYGRGHFPEVITGQLRDLLRQVGKTPLIVRSSSTLENRFGASFAGMYASYFCPNQGTLEDNLRDLTVAIRYTYASIYNPDVLLYRRRMGLLDYDERMAILLQEVQGQTYQHYFFPTLAGVAFSHSPFRWSRRLRRAEGFARLVVGLGTRAVERVSEDYPRLIALSHPLLRPEISPEDIRRYSQRLIDVIDLKDNTFKTLPLRQVLGRDYAALRWLASLDHGDMLVPLVSLRPGLAPDQWILTLDNLCQQSELVPLLKTVLSTLAGKYGAPVEVEFAITLAPDSAEPRLTFHLLQCRPHTTPGGKQIQIPPVHLPAGDRFFLATRMVPRGRVSRIEYIVYVDPDRYGQLADHVHRVRVAQMISRLNEALEGRTFILTGPGRWGSIDSGRGVPVRYGDICNARALVEMAVPGQSTGPEPWHGTRFFQNPFETRIFPIALYPDEPGDFLNRTFIQQAQNHLLDFLPDAAAYSDSLKVIHVPAERAGCYLDLVMDGERALASFSPQGTTHDR